MSSFQTALSAVLPMFIMLSLGVFLRKIEMVDEHTLNKMNKVCFRAFLAVSVYYNIYKVDIAEVFNGPYLAYAIVTQFVIVGISLVAAILGFLTQALGIKYPDMIANVFRDLGRCGTPVALIIMGGLFNFGAVKKNLKPIAVGVIFRLLVIPAIMIAVTVALGFRGADFIGLMCIFIAPCATTSFNLASAMDSDGDLAAQLVVFTSLCSLGTIFMWIYLLSNLGIF